MTTTDYKPVLSYWFNADEKINNMIWWGGKPEVDEEITKKFGETIKLAEQDKLEAWKKESKGILALIIVLDQFTRSVYRGTAKAFAQDDKAGQLSMQLQKHADFSNFTNSEKMFAFMPCMHAENIEMATACLNGFKAMGGEYMIKFAQDHLDILTKFKRYPHRNEILGRKSTKEEEEWVEENNRTKRYGFAIMSKKH